MSDNPTYDFTIGTRTEVTVSAQDETEARRKGAEELNSKLGADEFDTTNVVIEDVVRAEGADSSTDESDSETIVAQEQDDETLNVTTDELTTETRDVEEADVGDDEADGEDDGDGEDDDQDLPDNYGELQSLAKQYGIRANQSAEDLRSELRDKLVE